MGRYPEKIRKVRQISKKIIPKILKNKPMQVSKIIEYIKQQHPDLCDDSVKCECGGIVRKNTEWKHQIRWAIADLKYSEKITYSNKTELYSLI